MGIKVKKKWFNRIWNFSCTRVSIPGINRCSDIWVMVFKNGLGKICGRQPLKNWTDMVCLGRSYHYKFFKGCLPQILLGWIPCPNTLGHNKKMITLQVQSIVTYIPWMTRYRDQYSLQRCLLTSWLYTIFLWHHQLWKRCIFSSSPGCWKNHHQV